MRFIGPLLSILVFVFERECEYDHGVMLSRYSALFPSTVPILPDPFVSLVSQSLSLCIIIDGWPDIGHTAPEELVLIIAHDQDSQRRGRTDCGLTFLGSVLNRQFDTRQTATNAAAPSVIVRC